MDNSARPVDNLSSAAGALVGKAATFWTVAYTVPTARSRRFDDGIDDDTGKKRYRYELRDEVNLVVAGWRGAERFLAAWSANRTDEGVAPSFKADCAYWWTREHETVAQLPTEVVRWTSPTPTPVKVSFAELKKLVALPQM